MSKKTRSYKNKAAKSAKRDKKTSGNASGTAARQALASASAATLLNRLNRRNTLKLLVSAGIAGVGVSTLHAYDKSQKTLHDLSVIGQGQPVVIQIHDPGCPTCRRLKSAVTTAMKSSPDVLYRLADITTPQGKALQTKYAVPHVTLLFFDASGKHRHTTQGLLTVEQVRNNIERHLS